MDLGASYMLVLGATAVFATLVYVIPKIAAKVGIKDESGPSNPMSVNQPKVSAPSSAPSSQTGVWQGFKFGFGFAIGFFIASILISILIASLMSAWLVDFMPKPVGTVMLPMPR